MEEFVLYIARDKNNKNEYCRGSAMCLKITEVLPSNTINVQDCDMLRKRNVKFPIWLDGTPILVSNDSGDIYKGSFALRYLRELLEEYSDTRKQRNETENKKNTQNQLGDDEDIKEEEEGEEEYDPWNDDFSKVEHTVTEKPKATQQDVEEFMRKRQASMTQPDMNGNIPSIPQEQS